MADWRKDVKEDSPFLYHWDIEGKTPLTVEIEGFTREDAFCPGKGKQGSLFCLRFKGGKKVLGINVTNGHLIAHHHGHDRDAWTGKRIILRVAMCSGDKCIRVHAPDAKLPKQCKPFRYLDAEPGGAS